MNLAQHSPSFSWLRERKYGQVQNCRPVTGVICVGNQAWVGLSDSETEH